MVITIYIIYTQLKLHLLLHIIYTHIDAISKNVNKMKHNIII